MKNLLCKLILISYCGMISLCAGAEEFYIDAPIGEGTVVQEYNAETARVRIEDFTDDVPTQEELQKAAAKLYEQANSEAAAESE